MLVGPPYSSWTACSECYILHDMVIYLTYYSVVFMNTILGYVSVSTHCHASCVRPLIQVINISHVVLWHVHCSWGLLSSLPCLWSPYCTLICSFARILLWYMWNIFCSLDCRLDMHLAMSYHAYGIWSPLWLAVITHHSLIELVDSPWEMSGIQITNSYGHERFDR